MYLQFVIVEKCREINTRLWLKEKNIFDLVFFVSFKKNLRFCKSNQNLHWRFWNKLHWYYIRSIIARGFVIKILQNMTGSNYRKMHLVAITITKQNMNKELVVIKYGGGLITYKDQLCEANHAHINGLSEVVIIPIRLWSF